jgi:cleavage stimulation factor subunit 3
MWNKYIEMERELDETNNIVAILNDCLTKVPNVQLWQLYLDHVRRALPLMNDTDGRNRGQIAGAFEATLDNVGIDPEAGSLWREYIDFLKDGPGTIGGSSWQDLQKVDVLRKAYQRAFKIPHSEFVKMWKEYESFERTVGPQMVRKHIAEQSPHYMQARTAKTRLDQLCEGLDRSSLPRLPPIFGCAGEDEFGDQVERWRGWVAWEKNEDPLVFRGTEDEAYQKRVLYAYRQATMFLCFYPEIWFEAATWCFAQGGEKMTTEGDSFLDRGIAANPESVLLALMKADRVESSLETGNTDDVLIRNGEKLDVPFEGVHTALYALRTKMQERDKRLVAHIQDHFASLPPIEDAVQEQDEEEAANGTQVTGHEAAMKVQVEAVRHASSVQMDKLKRTISSVWVAKMQAFRRVQGQGKPSKKGEAASNTVKGFRGVFSDSRPRGMLSSDVYIASALMEWNCYRDPSAIKIFERGMKLFPSDETFVLEYIKHLIAGGDLTNARVVFESTVKKIADAPDMPLEQKRQKCRRLLGYMHEHESKYGDLAQIHKVEKRMRELYPEEPDISHFSHRYALPDFDAIDIQLIISPTQALPRPLQRARLTLQTAPPPVNNNNNDITTSIEAPEILLGPNGPYIASPKRPLDDTDDAEAPQPQRKFLRAESPLKGAAGIRIQNSKANNAHHAASGSIGGNSMAGGGGFAAKTFVPTQGSSAPPPLPPSIESLLQILPSASRYNQVRLDPGKLVTFLPGVFVDYAKAMAARP